MKNKVKDPLHTLRVFDICANTHIVTDLHLMGDVVNIMWAALTLPFPSTQSRLRWHGAPGHMNFVQFHHDAESNHCCFAHLDVICCVNDYASMTPTSKYVSPRN